MIDIIFFIKGLSNDINGGGIADFVRLYTSMPVLEDGLSSGHASDTENNNPISIVLDRQIYDTPPSSTNKLCGLNKLDSPLKPIPGMAQRNDSFTLKSNATTNSSTIDNSYTSSIDNNSVETCKIIHKSENDIDSIYSINITQSTPPPPAPVPHRTIETSDDQNDVQAALRDIKITLKRTQKIPIDKSILNTQETMETPISNSSPVWIPRNETSNSHESLESENPSKLISCDEEEADTDLETDRLLGQQRLDDQGFYDEKIWCDRKLTKTIKSPTSSSKLQNQINFTNTTVRAGNLSGNGGSGGGNSSEMAVCSIDDGENGGGDNIPISKSPTDSVKSKKDKNGKSRNKEGRIFFFFFRFF